MRTTSTMASVVVAAMLLAVSGSGASAALLVYEGWAYGASDLQIYQAVDPPNVLTPNASTIGMDTTVAYTGAAGGSSGKVWYRSAGLTFSDVPVTGGALEVFGAASESYLVGKLNLGTSVSGTVWSSALMQMTQTGTATGAYGPVMFVADGNTTAATHAAARFLTQSNTNTSNSTVVAAGYTNAVTDGTFTPTVGTTYLYVTKYENVGVALSAGAPGRATMWVLTEAQYDAIKSGGITEAELNANNSAKIVTPDVTSGTYNLATANYLRYSALGTGALPKGKVDEVRWGTTLADVVVPEPGTLAVLALGGIGLVMRRRRIA